MHSCCRNQPWPQLHIFIFTRGCREHECVCVWACGKDDRSQIFESQIRSMKHAWLHNRGIMYHVPCVHNQDAKWSNCLSSHMYRWVKKKIFDVSPAFTLTGSVQHVNRKLVVERPARLAEREASVYFEPCFVLSYQHKVISSRLRQDSCEGGGVQDCGWRGHSFMAHC